MEHTDNAEQRPVEVPVDGVLDLHTFRPAEAGELLDAYIAACRERGIRDLRVIHGKGTGALRARVHALLARHPAVESFGPAPGDAGGWGATLARLRPRSEAPRGPVTS